MTFGATAARWRAPRAAGGARRSARPAPDSLHDLQRDPPVQVRVVGGVDLAHAAASDRGQDLIAVDARAGRQLSDVGPTFVARGATSVRVVRRRPGQQIRAARARLQMALDRRSLRRRQLPLQERHDGSLVKATARPHARTLRRFDCADHRCGAPVQRERPPWADIQAVMAFCFAGWSPLAYVFAASTARDRARGRSRSLCHRARASAKRVSAPASDGARRGCGLRAPPPGKEWLRSDRLRPAGSRPSPAADGRGLDGRDRAVLARSAMTFGSRETPPRAGPAGEALRLDCGRMTEQDVVRVELDEDLECPIRQRKPLLGMSEPP